MREAGVKGIRLHSVGVDPNADRELHLWEIAYNFSEDEVVAVCPMVWRTYAVDELDMWVKFNKWFRDDAKGKPNNVIWIRM
jgi:hypothetical protein